MVELRKLIYAKLLIYCLSNLELQFALKKDSDMVSLPLRDAQTLSLANTAIRITKSHSLFQQRIDGARCKKLLMRGCYYSASEQ